MKSKNLDQWLEFISLTHPAEIEMGLERIKRVFDRLQISTKQSLTVIVGGTNGKGSTVAMLSLALKTLGYRVGTYTSPHILRYNERISVNQQLVSDEQLINAFEAIERVRGDIALTYFEYGTLAAFYVLYQAALDVVILEVGLGGRLDAVNIIDTAISIITSVDIDHSEYLGDTLDKIGTEKAGILRSDSLFIGGESLPTSVYDASLQLACKTLICGQDFRLIKGSKSRVTLEELEFIGFPDALLPENNILIALQASSSLTKMLSGQPLNSSQYKEIISAISALQIPGRLERFKISEGAEIVLDVGHNPHAARYLATYLGAQKKQGKHVQIVYSSLNDKDAGGVLKSLEGLVDRCCLAPLETPRAMPLQDLQAKAKEAGFIGARTFNSVEDAFLDATRYAGAIVGKNESIITLIFGSFYMVEAATRYFGKYDRDSR